MDEQILNTVYSSSLEFGKNFHRLEDFETAIAELRASHAG